MLSPRKERIRKRTIDLFKTLHYTNKTDLKRRDELMSQIIDEIDEIVEGEIDLTIGLQPRSGR